MKNLSLRADSAVLNLRPAVLVSALLAAFSATAQQPMVLLAQNLHAPAMHETVVTATRSEQALSDVVADISILDRHTIETTGVSSLADLLSRLPGVEMARNGGWGQTSSVFLRGAESRFTAVYIDGVRIDSQSTGGALWEQIPLTQIERIEVLRGSAAAVYGSDALGGVVQLFTRQGEGAAKPTLGIGWGSYGTRKVEAGISGTAGTDAAWTYSLGLAREISAGIDAKTPATAHNPDHDSYQSTSGHARLGLRVNAQHQLDATLLSNQFRAGYDSYGYVPDKPVNDQTLNRLHTAGLTWSAQWTEAYRSRLTINESTTHYETMPSLYRTETQLRGYLWQNEYRWQAHRFSAALERREDRLQNPAFNAWSIPLEGDRTQNALALGYGYQTGAHTLQLNARHDNDSEFGGKNTGGLAYGYALTPQWRFTVSKATAFRAPTLYQRFSEYGVATLRPETSHNTEVGLRWTQNSNTASVVAYRNRVSNLISFVGAGSCASAFGCYANTAKAQYEGVTLAGSYRWAGVQWRGSADWQNPRDLDSGKLLARRARRHATVGADTDWLGWTVGAEIQASANRFDNAANTQRLGGYTLVNLYASTRIAQDFTLLTRVGNLTDKDYQSAGGYANLGRAFYVGLKWTPQ